MYIDSQGGGGGKKIITKVWLSVTEILEWMNDTFSNAGSWSFNRLIGSLFDDVQKWITGVPTAMGYAVINIHLLVLFFFDFAYYHWIRPRLVYRKEHLKMKINSFWCVVERLSRLLTPFWRIVDSVENNFLSQMCVFFFFMLYFLLRLADCVIQLFAVPYIFGLWIEYATRSIRPVHSNYDESVMSLSLALKKLSMLQEQSLDRSLVTGLEKEQSLSNLSQINDTLFQNPMNLLWILLIDRSFLNKDATMHREALRVIENELVSRMLIWMIGFWYVLMTMRTFQQARHLMRMEFNAHWMRFPQPHQIPISLSLFRAMKERVISMRIHIPVIWLGIYVPCKLMRYCFPSIFPLQLSSKDVRNIPLV
ncbi:hypothetical protein RFI_18033 [Reticulomyxa filosa]|uniref:Transmembrane protein n=1 Tax=Reticulomyxa filosa TaxID=46433 RepID=X6MZX1_RETFI|nr:hypothetical protein RFI_18033 [Reticulomyxa filosa]|eukprot:ETO19198.1 hypothetical protein RFI_18033 [Reticulomyxa filosa]